LGGHRHGTGLEMGAVAKIIKKLDNGITQRSGHRRSQWRDSSPEKLGSDVVSVMYSSICDDLA